MQDKQEPCFKTLKTPLTTGRNELANDPAEEVVDTGPGAGRRPEPNANRNGVQTESIQGHAVEVEIRYDKPTEAERKAVENFFDWLLAEALSLTGEIDKAA